jgi:hypothetical protein
MLPTRGCWVGVGSSQPRALDSDLTPASLQKPKAGLVLPAEQRMRQPSLPGRSWCCGGERRPKTEQDKGLGVWEPRVGGSGLGGGLWEQCGMTCAPKAFSLQFLPCQPGTWVIIPTFGNSCSTDFWANWFNMCMVFDKEGTCSTIYSVKRSHGKFFKSGVSRPFL